jgi:hypothetical protein
MIAIENTLVSDELFDRKFVCDLNACKGACCVEGESGAPLDAEEIGLIEDDLSKILPFLTPRGKETIERTGVFTVDSDGDYVTPLNNGAECAFTIFDDKGIAKCGIEQAYIAGATTFRKPVSCHLYPVRLNQLKDYIAVNYHHWPICAPACACGEKLDVPVYAFLKDSLIRKFGEAWYQQLCEAAKLWNKMKDESENN